MGFDDTQSKLEKMLSNLEEEVGDTSLIKQQHSKQNTDKVEDVDKLLGELSGVFKKSMKASPDEQKTSKNKPLDVQDLSDISDEKLKKLFPTEEENADNKVNKPHVLVVDDDIKVLKMLQEILKVDYRVSVAPNGRLALKFLERHGTDLILLDYMMPGMNGNEVLEEIRVNPVFSDTPVFFLTGVADRDKVKECLRLRPKGYMLKPVKRDELLAKLRTILN